MDLRMYFRVISRFRYLVFAGLTLACVLTFFSVFHVSFAHGMKISYRQSQTFVSEEQLYLNTQGGVPFRTSTATTDPKTGAVIYPPNLVPPSSLGSTAILYAQLANSDLLKRLVPNLPGIFLAYPVSIIVNSSSTSLPFVAFDGYSTSPEKAVVVANRVSQAFISYVTQIQQAQKVPLSRRVLLDVSTKATTAKISKGRHYTAPIIVFLVVLIATLGLAFILENLRPARPVRIPEKVEEPEPLEPRLAASPVAVHEPTPVEERDGPPESIEPTRIRHASADHETTRV